MIYSVHALVKLRNPWTPRMLSISYGELNAQYTNVIFPSTAVRPSLEVELISRCPPKNYIDMEMMNTLIIVESSDRPSFLKQSDAAELDVDSWEPCGRCDLVSRSDRSKFSVLFGCGYELYTCILQGCQG
jgi:hypothetical protein